MSKSLGSLDLGELEKSFTKYKGPHGALFFIRLVSHRKGLPRNP
jgi:hypothetical protein